MYVVRIEHAVPDYQAWKAAFDGDPLGRSASGVRGYRVMRPVSDPGRVMIDLEFDDVDRAEAMVARLRELWTRVTVAVDPQAEVTEVTEVFHY
ncbi:hypothetical protein [Streptomyces sp. DH12]|uniref:hypothetical protein n=1 Tax=Streptomyces sp. DH12 TaxID=2857010 RepID=UPI001E48E666|nr:hypothetical protein [Streptomyces sp. DH12]